MSKRNRFHSKAAALLALLVILAGAFFGSTYEGMSGLSERPSHAPSTYMVRTGSLGECISSEELSLSTQAAFLRRNGAKKSVSGGFGAWEAAAVWRGGRLLMALPLSALPIDRVIAHQRFIIRYIHNQDGQKGSTSHLR